MHNHPDCRYMNLERVCSVKDLAAFHGHLGPYVVLGYRIGRYARRYFCEDPFSMRVDVYCSGTTPQSCLADGVQLGSGCTLGKRNIEILISNELKCVFFTDGKKIKITPKPYTPPERDSDYELNIEKYAGELYYRHDDELFTVEKL